LTTLEMDFKEAIANSCLWKEGSNIQNLGPFACPETTDRAIEEKEHQCKERESHGGERMIIQATN